MAHHVLECNFELACFRATEAGFTVICAPEKPGHLIVELRKGNASIRGNFLEPGESGAMLEIMRHEFETEFGL